MITFFNIHTIIIVVVVEVADVIVVIRTIFTGDDDKAPIITVHNVLNRIVIIKLAQTATLKV